MQTFLFAPFPTLRTERLLLRDPAFDDREPLSALRSNKEVNRYIDRPETTTLEDADAHIQKVRNGIASGKSIYWIICLAETQEIVGTICLWNLSDTHMVGECGYESFPRFHGKGLMSEALKAVLAYGFDEMELEEIEAFTHKENARSQRLLLRHQFVLVPERIDEDVPANVIFTLKR